MQGQEERPVPWPFPARRRRTAVVLDRAHTGGTCGPDAERPFARLEGGGVDGAVSAAGRVAGCYLHGLLHRGAARRAILADLGAASDGADRGAQVEAALDELAEVLARALDIDAIARIAGL